MTAATAEPTQARPTLDVSATPRTPFTRLVAVEFRKSYDTRAGFWLLATIGLLTVVTLAIMLLVAAAQDSVTFTYSDLVGGSAFVLSVMVPILGILLVTSEWSQRTAMTTFSLEPNRARVVMSKMAAGFVWACVVAVIALALGAAANVINGGLDGGATWDVGWQQVVGFFILQNLGMLSGFALAALLLNSPAAIVTYFVYTFVLPSIIGVAMALVGFFEKTLPWIDFQAAQSPLFNLDMSGEEVGQLFTSGFVWLVIPLAFGLWRILRAEVK